MVPNVVIGNRFKSGKPTDSPNNFPLKTFSAKNLIHENFQIMAFIKVNIYINTAIISKKFVKNLQTFPHKI